MKKIIKLMLFILINATVIKFSISMNMLQNTHNESIIAEVKNKQECIICREKKSNTDFVELLCSHTLCISCLDKIIESQQFNDQAKCPFCREIAHYKDGSLVKSTQNQNLVSQLTNIIVTQSIRSFNYISTIINEEFIEEILLNYYSE